MFFQIFFISIFLNKTKKTQKLKNNKMANLSYEITVKNIPDFFCGKDYRKNEALNDKKYDDMKASLIQLFEKYGDVELYDPEQDVDQEDDDYVYNDHLYDSPIFLYKNTDTLLRVYTELNGKMFQNDFVPFKLELEIKQHNSVVYEDIVCDEA